MRYAVPTNGKLGQIADVPQPVPYNKTPEQFLKLMFPDLSGWVQVADDNASGATDNGDGTYTNPAASPLSATPKILSASAFQDYCVDQLGGDATGMARFVEIMEAGAVSASKPVRFAISRYNKSLTFEKENVKKFAALLVSDGIMTPAEKTDITSNWPVL